MRNKSVIIVGMGFGIAVLLAACGKKEQTASTAADTTTPPLKTVPQGAPAAAPITGDAMLLGQTSASDSAEVALGAYMEKVASTKSVKAFAHNLVVDDTRRMHSATQLATQLHLALQRGATDSSAAEAARALSRLKTLAASDRDTAFISHEVASIQRAIAQSKRAASGAKATQVKQFIASETHGLEQQLSVGQRLTRLLSGVPLPGC